MIQILICSTWNVVKFSLPTPTLILVQLVYWDGGEFKRKGKNFYPHTTKVNECTGVGEVSDFMDK